jgi:hypothetical protein
MNDVTNFAIQLRYRVAFARVMESNKKFIDAASRYYDVSLTQNNQVCINLLNTMLRHVCLYIYIIILKCYIYVCVLQIVQNDLLELYGKSITCVILGKSSMQRTRMIKQLLQVIDNIEYINSMIFYNIYLTIQLLVLYIHA